MSFGEVTSCCDQVTAVAAAREAVCRIDVVSNTAIRTTFIRPKTFFVDITIALFLSRSLLQEGTNVS